MYIGPQVDTPPPAHRAEMDDNRHLAGKGHSAAPQMHAKRPDALSIKSRVIRDHLGQALPNEQRAVTLRPSLNRAPPALLGRYRCEARRNFVDSSSSVACLISLSRRRRRRRHDEGQQFERSRWKHFETRG